MTTLWKKLMSRWSGTDESATVAPEPSRPEVISQTGRLHLPSAVAGDGHDPIVRYEVIASLLTDIGCRRKVNEDSGRYVYPRDERVLANKGLLAIVADGMGGHSAGDVASRIATEVINRVYYDDDAEAGEALKRAFREANRQIFEAARNDRALEGMGTTCTTLVLRQGKAICAHVGDSRLYLVRDRNIYVLTEDHSAVMEMVKRGLLTQGEARHHADKNVILRALGSHADVQVTVWNEALPIREGDRFLICSDGLYDLVEDEEIKQAVVSQSPHAACESLIELAKARGGYDNITVGVLSVTAAISSDAPTVRATREVQAVNGLE
jgi:serine/threonine protein phosphatase PrpC